MVHRGPFSDIDTTYGALGTYVAERAIGAEGPVREHYLMTDAETVDHAEARTEVCWPIST
jgi:effector-binding domain-containing protein